MGLVDFAIDFAAVLGASRNIASKHVALRSRQLNRYGRTSSLVAAVKAKPRTGAEATATNFGEGKAGSTAAARDQDAPRNDTQDAADLSTASIHGGAQKSSALGSATLQSSGNMVSEQPDWKTSEVPIQPASNSSSLRESRSQIEREVKFDKSDDSSASNQVESQAKADEEPIPEGVNLDLFRTSRGSRLSPLWKDNRRERPIKPIVSEDIPEGVDLGVFRTGRGSSVLRGLDGKARASGGVAASTVLPEMRRTVEKATSSKAAAQEIPNFAIEHLSPSYESHRETEVSRYPDPAEKASNVKTTPKKAVARDSPDPRVDHVSPQYESRRETEESEVPRYPDPFEEVSGVKTAATYSEPKTDKPVSKDDAVEFGEMLEAAATPKYELRESRVPSSRLGRIWSYGGLAAGMLTGAVSEFSSRAIGGGGQGSLMFSPANMERLVAKLSTMRGAALKIGQMMSFQDEKMLPTPIQEVLQRVQDRADYMPAWQRDRVLTTNLGAEWRELYEDFEEKPIAAASIGQVHRAVLKSTGAKVAVKIQYPGVADSINSDLNNLRMLLAASKLLPKGLYLDKTIGNARVELGWECDYEREAQCALRYKSLLASESDVFRVPHIYPEASGKQVLTMEFMGGVGVTRIAEFTQAQRDWIGTQILRLCLREITEFHFMQTDPNWTNFLYDAERDRLVLLDFGASREYPERFIALYVQLLAAAARTDRDAIQALSVELRYLTGHESKTMLDAHTTSILTLAEPFLQSAPEVYDFKDQTITERVKAQIPVMIKERLAPPPEETYSLHRKLSGAFLLCARLGSRVRCREMFENAVIKSGVLDKKV